MVEFKNVLADFLLNSVGYDLADAPEWIFFVILGAGICVPFFVLWLIGAMIGGKPKRRRSKAKQAKTTSSATQKPATTVPQSNGASSTPPPTANTAAPVRTVTAPATSSLSATPAPAPHTNTSLNAPTQPQPPKYIMASVHTREDVIRMSEKADRLLSQGKVRDALMAHQKCLELSKKLAQENPKSQRALRDVTVAYDRMGDAFAQVNELNGAKAAYKNSLQIRENLASVQSPTAQSIRDVLISYCRMAEITEEQDWWKKALATAEHMAEEGILPEEDAWMLDGLKEQISDDKVLN